MGFGDVCQTVIISAMPARCYVAGCDSIYGKKANVLLHVFPKDEELRRKWINLCARKGTITPATPKICSRHFDQAMYERNLKYELLALPVPNQQKRLKPGALPTLYLPKNEGEFYHSHIVLGFVVCSVP